MSERQVPERLTEDELDFLTDVIGQYQKQNRELFPYTMEVTIQVRSPGPISPKAHLDLGDSILRKLTALNLTNSRHIGRKAPEES